jgi:hypothetical protein
VLAGEEELIALRRNIVMAGLVPAIHVLLVEGTKDVDARDKPGHDEHNPVQRAYFFGLVKFTSRLKLN